MYKIWPPQKSIERMIRAGQLEPLSLRHVRPATGIQNPGTPKFLDKKKKNPSPGPDLSGPVSRDAARLSQRYPHIARYGVFGVSTWPIGCDTPPAFLSVSPLESMRSGGAIPPRQKGYLSDTCAIPFESKANGCDTPLCDTISKGYCAIWGGISHWAA